MFKTKICGITDSTVAEECCQAGADAIGLNFFAKSKRRVNIEQAQAIAETVSGRTLKVGLFVNHSSTRIQTTVSTVGLDCIQLHGDETPDLLRELDWNQFPGVSVIRAIRLSQDNQFDALRQIEAWSECQYSNHVGALLLDANVPKAFGGTGQSIDWEWLSELTLPTDKPTILAGGLTPENVGTAIELVRPDGVDVAGGVENSAGQKDKGLIDRFVRQAQRSFERIAII